MQSSKSQPQKLLFVGQKKKKKGKGWIIICHLLGHSQKKKRSSVWGDEGLTISQADFNTAAKRWLPPFSHSTVQL